MGVESVGEVIPPPYVDTAHSAQEAEHFADAQEDPEDDIYQVQVVQLSASRGRFEPEGIEFASHLWPPLGSFASPSVGNVSPIPVHIRTTPSYARMQTNTSALPMKFMGRGM